MPPSARIQDQCDRVLNMNQLWMAWERVTLSPRVTLACISLVVSHNMEESLQTLEVELRH